MPFKLNADQLKDYIQQNEALAERAAGEGNDWLARELKDVAREAADQLASLVSPKLLGGH